ncbi:MAG: hypothetical protein EOP35_16385 [Rubrivivax sp.]|nr:MAG: hypothetical protein EOP35_16385 [Rubrivivax sp.]
MTLAPWLAVAAAGALHGLNPCTGWALATACSARSGRHPLRALGPIALGHAASVTVVATWVALGLALDGVLAVAAGVGLGGVLLLLGLSRLRLRAGRAGPAGLALGSFLAATLHGSGLMLVPALVPLCLSASPAREITASGSLLLALAAVAVHMAAMLSATGAAAWAAGAGLGALRRRRLSGRALPASCPSRPRGGVAA